MRPGRRRVVITGAGAVTPSGLDWAAFRAPLAAGRARRPPHRARSTRRRLPGPHRRRDRGVRRQGLRGEEGPQAAQDDGPHRPAGRRRRPAGAGRRAARAPARSTRTGSASCSAPGTIPGDLADLGPAAQASLRRRPRARSTCAQWGSEGLALIPPLWMLKYLPNMPACHVSILHDAQGPNNTITESDAASLLALGEAFRISSATPPTSSSSAAPTRAPTLERRWSATACSSSCRAATTSPSRRAGRSTATATARSSARGRACWCWRSWSTRGGAGRAVYAEVVGFASALRPRADRATGWRGRPRGAGRGRRRARRTSTTSTPTAGDGRGRRLGGARPRARRSAAAVPVLAVKSYLGNLGAGGGAPELAASLLALSDGLTCRRRSTTTRPTRTARCTSLREPRPVRRPYVLKVACTDRGSARRW